MDDVQNTNSVDFREGHDIFNAVTICFDSQNYDILTLILYPERPNNSSEFSLSFLRQEMALQSLFSFIQCFLQKSFCLKNVTQVCVQSVSGSKTSHDSVKTVNQSRESP